MTPVALTAITDLILSAEAFFLAGRMTACPKVRFSAAWFWSGVLFLLGLAALIGGIDHGFFENAGLPRYWIERPNWIVLALLTWCVLMTAARQFLPGHLQRIVMVLGAAQFVVDAILALRIDSFLVVILNYTPVMILMLVLSCAGLRKGTGSYWMIAGILILFSASAIQALMVDTFSPLDRNGLYHVITMIGVVFLYQAGTRLRR